jgi:ribosomal protein L7/L12
MSDTEVVLTMCVLVLGWLNLRKVSTIRELREIIIRVGLKEARIEIDGHIVNIIPN